MLRQELGDDAFFKGVRQIIQEGTGQYFEWKDLKRVFSQIAGRDLTTFFKQLVEQPGAPSVTLHGLSIRPDPVRSDQSIVSGTISQKHATYKLPLPIQVNLQDESTFSATLKLNQANQPFTLKVPGIPTSITLDPEHNWLLRLQREQLPPMLNGWDTDVRRIFVHAKTSSREEEASLQVLMKRIHGQPDVEIHQADSPAITEAASYLIIGTPARQLL